MSKAATEAEIGFLHALVTKLHVRRLERMLEQMDVDNIAAEFAVDDKILRVAQKWVIDNGVTAAPDAQQENNALNERLKKIKDKMGDNILDFKRDAADRGVG